MNVNYALRKLDNTLNVLLMIQVLTTVKTVGWSLFILSTSGGGGSSLGGTLFRSILQGVITIYLVNKMKNELSTLTAWLIFACGLASGFASSGSFVGTDGIFFYYGLFEIILVICTIIFMVKYYNYKSAVSREKKNAVEELEERQ